MQTNSRPLRAILAAVIVLIHGEVSGVASSVAAEVTRASQSTSKGTFRQPGAAPSCNPSSGDQQQAYVTGLVGEIQRLREENARLNSPAYRIELKYYKAWYRNLARQAELSLKPFSRQDNAFIPLLILVFIVVASGVCFSGYQLIRGAKLGEGSENTQLELSLKQIKITSSLVGLVVLTLSVVFLYLFLREVYRVNPLRLPEEGKTLRGATTTVGGSGETPAPQSGR